MNATDKQIRFLTSLVRQTGGQAILLDRGIYSMDELEYISKREASQLIDLFIEIRDNGWDEPEQDEFTAADFDCLAGIC